MSLVAPGGIDRPALAVFVALFALVSGLGFVAARWRRPRTLAQLDEWGLGGRSFGTWITWFLIGGDLYTAYTVIAVPALVFATGAYGFFALPYAVLIYPLMFAVMPALWRAAARTGAITAADVVRARWGSRPLEVAIALTDIMATMPYIALQLVGMQVVIRAMGIGGDLPLVGAFAILALYTYSAGLRAPALIAFVKDFMIIAVVLVVVVLVPLRLGGYGHVFHQADLAFRAHARPGAGLLLSGPQMLPYATVALGSTLGVFLYPHTLTGMFAASGEDTIRRNAVLLPFYTLLLGLVALLGLMALAAGIHPATATAVVPALFHALFAPWFAGFAYAAIAIGALVPAAVMSIGAANLFSRNIWHAFTRADATPAAEARVARVASLVVKLGALLAILFLPTEFAIDLQLLGGIWILQSFPAVILGLAPSPPGWARLNATGLLAGWGCGITLGSALAVVDGLKPVHVWSFAMLHPGLQVGLYSGLVALLANLAVAYAVSVFGGENSVSPVPLAPL